jgi:hypothetical protein
MQGYFFFLSLVLSLFTFFRGFVGEQTLEELKDIYTKRALLYIKYT